ncbi:unnamed protein product, partial [Vitis vinifera]
MAAITYSVAPKYQDFYDNTTTTAIVQYSGYYTPSSPPSLPYLPAYNDTNASVQVMAGLRSLANAEHPCNVPLSTSTNLIYTVSVNSYPCVNNSCAGANGTRFSSSINNISFHTPTVDILQAYYYNISGVYGDKFPSDPPLVFDFTADYLPLIYQLPSSGTEVRVLEYNSTVEIVFQGTNVLAATHHPMHLHGYSFYVVGWGFGNFDGNKDPLRYNLVDPPFQNTISVPSNGWVAIRFEASNPVYNFPFLIADTFKLTVDHGKTYLLRIINAALQEALFFSIDKHKMTVVGTDGSYTKPLTRDFITIFPGQTYDVLLEANQRPDHYYMAAITYSVAPKYQDFYDNTTTTAIVQYNGYYTPSSPPSLPYLPAYNDTNASVQVMAGLRSLANAEHPCNVPLSTSTNLIYTVSVNSYPCVNNSCAGANGTRFSSSINNISFHTPTVDILQAYYYNISGIYGDKFPSDPPLVFDFTADYLPLIYQLPSSGTEVRVLEYNSTVDIVFQGTNVLAATHHPMHLHGYSFYVVGWGFGNFDGNKDPLRYNMVDPPFQNTISVPSNGWVAIRFEASNPGVWFMHCHVERHLTWGMETAFIVKNGKHPEAQMLPPPSDMPPC